MKNEKGIGLIKLIVIVVIIVAIIFIIANSQGKVATNIDWDDIPAVEYYELRLAATTSEVYGSGSGKLSLESFNTLGRAVKKANGKWFKDSNVNFSTFIFDDESGEGVSLTDGEHVAIFLHVNGNDYVGYIFCNEKQLEYYNKTDKNLLGGYRITIE